MLYFFFVGLLSGIVLGALGSSWGAVAIPMLILLGLGGNNAKGVGLLSEVVVGLVGFAHHRRLGNVNTKLVLVLLAGSLVAFLASLVSTTVPDTLFRFLLGIIEIFSGISLIFLSRTVAASDDGIPYVLLASGLAGFVKGFFGAGWGPISLLLLVLAGVPLRTVAGSSILPTLAVTLSSSFYYLSSGYFELIPFVFLTLGGLPGVIIGSLLHDKIPEALLRRTAGLIILVIGMSVLLSEWQ